MSTALLKLWESVLPQLNKRGALFHRQAKSSLSNYRSPCKDLGEEQSNTPSFKAGSGAWRHRRTTGKDRSLLFLGWLYCKLWKECFDDWLLVSVLGRREMYVCMYDGDGSMLSPTVELKWRKQITSRSRRKQIDAQRVSVPMCKSLTPLGLMWIMCPVKLYSSPFI